MYSSFQLDALSFPLDRNLLHLPMVEFLGAPPWLRLFFCAGMRVCREAQGSARAALPIEALYRLPKTRYMVAELAYEAIKSCIYQQILLT